MHELSTQRLALRALARADVPAVCAMMREPAVRKYLCDDRLLSDAEVRAWVEASDAAFANGRAGLWTVAESATADPIGLVGFIQVYEPPVEELIFAIATAHTRRGFATESARAVMSWATRNAGMTTFRASTDEPNEASLHTLRRLCFVPCGSNAPPHLPWRQLHFELGIATD